MKSLHFERLGELVLARLCVRSKTPPSLKVARGSLYVFVARELTAAQWEEAFDSTLGALRAAGSVEEERLVLTERGWARLTQALHLRAAPRPKTWAEFQSKYLPRLLLDPPPSNDEVAPALGTALLAQRLKVPLGPRSTPTQVIDTWLAQSLGLTGK
ncbi:MAG TPA: hypothetical protein VJU61_22130, partial [Polyangiaceae bacterium]|nr:hypothetical protein [Polyangiaceae bacterium]